jgi:DNA-binding transcriptional ArsR family regulator
MKEGPDIATLAALIGDPARANMLCALMDGRALTAGELAREAGVTPQTASSHLARLVDGALLLIEVQGRHRYFRIAGPDIAQILERLMELASRTGHSRTRTGPKDPAMRRARFCYDHLAGEAGVALHDALISQALVVAGLNGLELSPKGRTRFIAEGIDITALEAKPRVLCKSCLDWSERRHHLAGSLATAIAQMILARGWARRETKGRAVVFSQSGQSAFAAFLTGNMDAGTHQSRQLRAI